MDNNPNRRTLPRTPRPLSRIWRTPPICLGRTTTRTQKRNRTLAWIAIAAGHWPRPAPSSPGTGSR